MTTEQTPVAVVGMGAVASVGLYPEAIAAAAAGGISRARTVETMRNTETGAPVKLALCPQLKVHTPLKDRLLWLGEIAARRALAPLEAAPSLRLAVLIALPQAHAGFPKGAATRVGSELLTRLNVTPVRELCGASAGAEGGVAGIGVGCDLLREGHVDVCLVGGIDSYCDTDALEPLARENRLKAEDAPSGIIPGEGAGFLLLMLAETAAQLGLAEQARIVSVGARPELNPWYTGRSTQGRGLSRAFSRVFHQQPPSLIAHATYADLNGEHWRAEEWSFAYLRSAERHADPLEMHHPAEAWGDVGAASVFLLSTTAIVDHQRGRSRGPGILVFCSSDRGPIRGAIFIEARTGGTQWHSPSSSTT